jgi:DNA-binding IclR family transcriptional regulator
MRRIRPDQDYTIEALSKGLDVLEALVGHDYEPVTISELQRRTGFTYDFTMRALRTLKLKGWAIETDRGWKLSVKAMHFSEQFITYSKFLIGNPQH